MWKRRAFEVVALLIAIALVQGTMALTPNSYVAPDSRSYTVNLGRESNLRFTTQYSVSGALANASDATWRFMRNSTVLARGEFVRVDTGSYLFDHDFKDAVTGDYTLLLTFDGRSETVDVHIISVGGEMELFLDSDGKVSTFRIIVAGVFLAVFIATAIIFVRRIRGGRRRAR